MRRNGDAECNRDVLDEMMAKITGRFDLHCNARVACKCSKHVIEKRLGRRDDAFARSAKLDADACFTGFPDHDCHTANSSASRRASMAPV